MSKGKIDAGKVEEEQDGHIGLKSILFEFFSLGRLVGYVRLG